MRPQPKTVLFFRENSWYFVEVQPHETILQHVRLNPETTKVTDFWGEQTYYEKHENFETIALAAGRSADGSRVEPECSITSETLH